MDAIRGTLDLAVDIAANTADLPRPKAEEAGRAFESWFAETILREMRKTAPGGIFSGPVMDVMAGMLDRAVAEAIADSGGLGLAEFIEKNLPGTASPELAPATPISPGHGHYPVEGTITSGFGLRRDPFDHESRMHKGVDIAASRGSPIRPVASGVVHSAGIRQGYGLVVSVDHGDGWSSLYAHCDSIAVNVGQRVGSNTQLGTVGSTGRSTGPHLHLEIHHNGEAVDPAQALDWR